MKEEAALALAEMDRFVDAKPTLLDLAKEPSERGRMAKAYLKVNELTEDINRKPASAAKYDFKQLEEAIDLLKQNYWDENKIVVDKLIEAAVRGACSSLDPYTTYMDEAAIKELKEEGLGGRYGGIGARVWADLIPGPEFPTGRGPGPADSLDLALHGGEDYELLFTVPPGKTGEVPVRFRDVPLNRIGEICRSKGVALVRPDGAVMSLGPGGYDHFAE